MKKNMHSLRARVTVALIASLWLSPALSVEKDKGFFIGGSVGQAFVEDESGDLDTDRVEEEFDLDSDDTGYKAFAGYRFGRHFAVEGGFVDFGEPDDSSEGIRVQKDIEGIDVFAVGLLPVWRFDLFGKVGLIDWETTTKVSGRTINDKRDDDGTDPAFGLGAAFGIGSFSIRGEAEFFDLEDADDLYMLSVGGTFTF